MVDQIGPHCAQACFLSHSSPQTALTKARPQWPRVVHISTPPDLQINTGRHHVQCAVTSTTSRCCTMLQHNASGDAAIVHSRICLAQTHVQTPQNSSTTGAPLCFCAELDLFESIQTCIWRSTRSQARVKITLCQQSALQPRFRIPNARGNARHSYAHEPKRTCGVLRQVMPGSCSTEALFSENLFLNAPPLPAGAACPRNQVGLTEVSACRKLSQRAASQQCIAVTCGAGGRSTDACSVSERGGCGGRGSTAGRAAGGPRAGPRLRLLGGMHVVYILRGPGVGSGIDDDVADEQAETARRLSVSLCLEICQAAVGVSEPSCRLSLCRQSPNMEGRTICVASMGKARIWARLARWNPRQFD
eukprot:jgi/Ulvmu1/6865/UM031_0070.1